MITSSACPRWQADRAANAAEEHSSYTTRWDTIAVAYEAGRDGFWLARWLRGQGIEVHVIHSSSVAVSRDTILEDSAAG
jgi:transposase